MLIFKYRKNYAYPANMKLLPRLSKLIVQLSRRRVIRAVSIYLVTLWLLAQGVADLFPAFGLPDWSVRAFVLIGLLGLPLAIYLAWRYELTPQGLIPDTGAIDDDATLVDFPLAGVINVNWKDTTGKPKFSTYHSEFVIGRDPEAELYLIDKRVSRHHARVFSIEKDWWVEDLASSNGTFIDGVRVKREMLPHRCKLQLHPEGPVLSLEVISSQGTAS